ncbi:pancreas/duodenum homeobox protein 1 [Desulfoluna sp.]|uniref:pancreas/duodenum homeobox protein 1 n=1 Tax=Desulfoluna sp. TaxID=2045199 RepID=UPI0026330FA0|nr:pancreas/duodenum homeobox protein 1 [Desulfoluna sp.]
MIMDTFRSLFTADVLAELFPTDFSDQFFEALYGDADDGAYDISLALAGGDEKTLEFELRLAQRPGKCLVCSLTYGLPEVFSRHPLINIAGLVEKINAVLGETAHCTGWQMGRTRELSRALHVVPLSLSLA